MIDVFACLVRPGSLGDEVKIATIMSEFRLIYATRMNFFVLFALIIAIYVLAIAGQGNGAGTRRLQIPRFCATAIIQKSALAISRKNSKSSFITLTKCDSGVNATGI